MQTETKPTYTPTPWEVSGELDDLKIIAKSKEEYACDETLVIANVVPGDFEIAEYDHCEANAAFIVRAVNAHEELVRALNSCALLASRYMWAIDKANISPEAKYEAHRTLAQCQDALAKAEGRE